ncbi:MAG: hypothetical protein JRC68_05615 [Deltaproteobacteria bacterium]|nr:hypothetical protein [Deltaproteobacteria bacterium]
MRDKKRIFLIIKFTLPLVLFLMIELGLRAMGWFAQEPFFIDAWKNGEKDFQLNDKVASRYFDESQIALPQPPPMKFLKTKTRNTFRIFCIGASTLEGFPFEWNVTFPSQLRYMLSRSFPEYGFEVINTGMAAVNSYTALDLLPEVLEVKPDLILFYMGHNEFYGAFGSASTVKAGKNDAYIRLYLLLQRLHTTQSLRWLFGHIALRPELQNNGSSLMEVMVKDQEVYYGSEKYELTMKTFQRNLERIVKLCKKKKVPVIFSKLVSNIRDLKPFESRSSLNLSADERELIAKYISRAESHASQKDFVKSIQLLESALEIDSTQALPWYRLGQYYEEAGDYKRALNAFLRAKDRDLIRFRASEDINEIIADVADERQIHVVDMPKVFSLKARNGLLGNEWICDHLHPTPNGYFIMAKAFYNRIIDSGLLNNPAVGFAEREMPYNVTALDYDIGLIKIHKMVHRWPFTKKRVLPGDYVPYGDEFTLQLVNKFYYGGWNWARIHYEMAEEFLRRGEFEKALQSYFAVIMDLPEEPYPYIQAANIYGDEKKFAKQEEYLRKAFEYSDQKGMLNYQLAMCLWQQKKIGKAIITMSEALSCDDLDNEQRLKARLYHERMKAGSEYGVLK